MQIVSAYIINNCLVTSAKPFELCGMANQLSCISAAGLVRHFNGQYSMQRLER